MRKKRTVVEPLTPPLTDIGIPKEPTEESPFTEETPPSRELSQEEITRLQEARIKQTEEQTALMIPVTGGIDIRKRGNKGLYLPYGFFGNPKNETHSEYTFALMIDSVPVKIETPEITHIWASEVCRKTEGAKYTDRLYGHLPHQAEEFKAAELDIAKNGKDSQWAKGINHFIFILNKGIETFATMEGIKGMDGYTQKLFELADVNEDKKVRILLNDHAKNLITSKDGFKYLGPKNLKFGLDYEIAPFTDEDKRVILEKKEEQKDAIEKYLRG